MWFRGFQLSGNGVNQELGTLTFHWTDRPTAVFNHVVMILKALAGIRWRRTLLVPVSITFTLGTLLLLTSYITFRYAHHKALKLLAEVRTLEPGKTTVEEVKKLVQRYGGEEYDAHTYSMVEGSDKKYTWPDPCQDDAPSFAVYASPPLFLTGTIQRFPILQRIGLHPWFVSLNFRQKEGKITCYSQNALFIRPDGQEVEADADLTLRNPESPTEKKTYEPESFVSRNYYHVTRVSVLREASAEQKSRAFQMDLSCTVSLRGCYFPCEIMPLGWLDSVRDDHSHRWGLPEGAGDRRCPAL
jgi:hypothetical protein